MPNTVLSPNMNITVPVNLTDPTPDWGARIQTALQTTIDAHDHSAGKGVQVPTAGININADLNFNSFNGTSVRSTRFASQGAPLALGPDVNCAYVSAGELWYNDAAARQVQITNLGALKLSPVSLIVKSVTTSYTILSGDGFQLYYCQTGTGAVAIALPSSATVANGRVYYFADEGQNSGTTGRAITLVPNGADTINGVNATASITANGATAVLMNDSSGKWTMNVLPRQPIGQASSTVAVTTGTVTLTAAQLASQVIQFTGTLVGAVTLVFPNSAGYFICDFSQVVMGAFSIACSSGSSTSANLTAADVGTTDVKDQMSFVLTYGANTIRIRA